MPPKKNSKLSNRTKQSDTHSETLRQVDTIDDLPQSSLSPSPALPRTLKSSLPKTGKKKKLEHAHGDLYFVEEASIAKIFPMFSSSSPPKSTKNYLLSAAPSSSAIAGPPCNASKRRRPPSPGRKIPSDTDSDDDAPLVDTHTLLERASSGNYVLPTPQRTQVDVESPDENVVPGFQPSQLPAGQVHSTAWVCFWLTRITELR